MEHESASGYSEGDSERTLIGDTPCKQTTPAIKTSVVVKKPFKSPVVGSRKPTSPLNLDANLALQNASIEDQKLIRELKNLENELDAQIRVYDKRSNTLKQGVKIASLFEKEEKVMCLIVKWRGVCEAGLSYLMNSTMLKINQMGGYEEFRRKEIENEKRKIEYQSDNGLQDQMDEMLESEEFRRLPIEEQEEIKQRIEDKTQEMRKWRQAEFERLENQLTACANQEMTMEELAKRLKVEYKMIFPPASR